MKKIENISKDDIECIHQLIDVFQDRQMLFLDDPFSCLLVIYCDNKLIGYLSYGLIYDRSELNYIVILDEYRNQGYAKQLMDYYIGICEYNDCKNITLEVNEHNSSAIGLYTKFGFQIAAFREHYYPDGDGYLMIREFD